MLSWKWKAPTRREEARALAELVEYLRAGVQLLYDERDTGRALH